MSSTKERTSELEDCQMSRNTIRDGGPPEPQMARNSIIHNRHRKDATPEDLNGVKYFSSVSPVSCD